MAEGASSTVEVPPYFLCPISLEIMRDPVTLATGITYDRASIERWLEPSDANAHHAATCPVTRRKLAPEDRDATPNHTLRRLIQAWCALHEVERFPTPRPPIDACRVAALVEEARGAGRRQEELAALREIKVLAAESDRNRRCVEATPGAVDFLLSVVTHSVSSSTKYSSSAENLLEQLALDSPTSTSSSSPEEDALSVIYALKPSKKTLLRILERNNNGDLLDTLVRVLRRPSYRARTYAVLLLKAVVSVMEPARLMTVGTAVVQEVVRVVSDGVSAKAVKAALHVLCRLCPWGRNRVKAVEAGAMAVLVELLLDEGGRHPTELAVVAIDHLCGCAEGRAELAAHPAGLAVVSKKALRVSPATTESAVRALHAVARHSPTPAVLQEMLAVGVVAKLLLVLRVDSGEKARAKAKELLRTHARVWKDSPCLPAHLKAYYPC